MTAEVRTGLVRMFADELDRCAAHFGGRAREWPMRYGIGS
jgi:hypothetical protein